MRRYSVWCEDWAASFTHVVEVRVQGCWTRKGMVRKVRRLNAGRPADVSYRFYGQENR